MAGRIVAADIAAVRERVSIVEVIGGQVTLRPAGGGNLKGLCPFHEEKSPSFNVTPQRGVFYCFGCGKGGLFELDENLRPKRFLIDLRSAGSDRGMPEVHGADADGQTLAVAFEKPVWPHMLTIEVRSADASKVLRSESVLPPGRFDSIEEEPARLSKLGDGYFYAGGELAWIPTDPAKPIWRFTPSISRLILATSDKPSL